MCAHTLHFKIVLITPQKFRRNVAPVGTTIHDQTKISDQISVLFSRTIEQRFISNFFRE